MTPADQPVEGTPGPLPSPTTGGSTFRQELRRFGSHGLIYACGTIAMRLVGFVLVPIYTKHLPESDYGVLGLLTLVTQVVMTFLGLGLMNAMFRHWAGAREEAAKRRLVSTTVWTQTITACVGFGIFLANPSWWAGLLLGSSEAGDFVLLAVGAGLLDMFGATVLGLVRMEERPGFFTAVMLVRTILSTALAVWLVAWRGAGLMGVLEANLAGALASLLMVLPFTIRQCGWTFDGALFREMLRFGGVYTVSATASLFLTMGDRYVVKFVMSLAAVGIYTLGQQLAVTINVVGQSFLNAYLPLGLKRDVSVDGGRFVTKTFTYFTFGLTWAALGFSLLSREIVLVLARSPGYYPALTVVPLLVLAAVVYVLGIAMEISFYFAGKAGYIVWPTLLGVALVITLSFTLVPIFGIMGAALAATVAAFGRLGLLYFWARRVYPLPYDMPRVMLVLAGAAVAHLVLFAPLDGWAYAGLKAVVALVFPAVMWYAGFFTPYERQEIRARIGAFFR